MHRCLELAKLGAGYVAPNPMVGAVLVYNERIIGEGYHKKYGEAHAEVNCIASVSDADKKLIPESVLYVSLEPCVHFGKTPPCADLIIKYKIPKVVIGCRDPFKEVDGKGIEKLKAAGVDVECGILENECKEINKRFFCFHTKHRPYIILKWAQTADKKIAGDTSERLLISNEYTNHLVHKWRSEEASILVGTNTALQDNPELTTRLWNGPSPVRLVIDMDLRLPKSLKLFDRTTPTIIFNSKEHDMESFSEGLGLYQVTEDVSLVPQMMNALHRLNIQSVMVEGGARLLQSFIDEGVWDEAKIITNEQLNIENGLTAPELSNAEKITEENMLSDKIEFYRNTNAY
ncbi:MAG TPA: bifunctional diaminohydroxyphosphoribosylaminopyrimidine deaminase/5-amino-6-(5-phosphoribosylamino)uracil reductase RibD [Chitinophagaceae bacterium]|nr:bifunctional diaminohydroxyphosphoribosylaminopyrimidine deaminase/5-amino-6-(5-phosphoribosylamino)uracil reductase RibD [Chitinophagaceae bacterium]